MLRISLVALLFLNACSSSLPPHALATTSHTQLYSYCESCPAASVLRAGGYKPLQPDEPLVQAMPVVESAIIKPVSRRVKNKPHKTHKPRKKITKPKQCIQWR